MFIHMYLGFRLLKLLSTTLLPSPPVTTKVTLGDDGSESKTASSYVDLNQLQLIGKGAYGNIYGHSAVDLQDKCVKVYIRRKGTTKAHLTVY